jgi:hypothetical protein
MVDRFAGREETKLEVNLKSKKEIYREQFGTI